MGRRRSCGSQRWIAFRAIYDVHADDTATFGMVFRDDDGFIPVIPKAMRVGFDPAVMSADEAVRQAVHQYIDTTPLPPGVPPDPNWRPLVGRGGMRLL